MPGKFLIDDRVIFDADNRTLSLAQCTLSGNESAQDSVVLHTPTAQCLILLIEYHGKILSQEYILEKVWINKGVVVSSGAVYQNISLLRRAFVQLGIDSNIVATIPRRGVMLPAGVTVSPWGKTCISSDYFPPREDTKNSIPAAGISFFTLPYVAISAALGLLAILGILFSVMHFRNKENYMDGYQPVKNNNPRCHIYMNKAFPGHMMNKILAGKVLSCDELPYHYITAFHGINRYSVISCEQDIRQPDPDCLSRFYLKDS
ncbi:winged helix-turn-helix domain-containing protein [Shimwellia blattae]|uniref:Putative signal transduction response regulator n=1 Tax=Shimwellia blattae (strain ATCC 29907 / DSM 4481 / JCM 1650 / NBRC 105725 / CDC 9005-74) TaxID=630626 RepID=I2BD89_SHIBC|nr:winged helix-turn-helix domain-containing protein [Shimwellia blattae]AFJ48493.1 putative signal transduction response regulator [Shimwellia blattae DSM 4481 = NBRC 105725]GAB82567.1 hypothetical protein EB105725_26_00490 [Shimwellia blattae DSM 4481 = NBRC 105725]VDY65986.1 Transcriptional regulatory protein, C terminal [Shimwellia blattae]VEC26538.1 Transcriptional regulatory protein, C terminal [Shimwellia blattae]